MPVLSSSPSFPLLIAPGGTVLSADDTVNLIETVLKVYREGQAQSPVPAVPRARRASLRASDGPAVVPKEPLPPASDRSRKRYTLTVSDGRTLQLVKPTPAMTNTVDYIRKHPGATIQDIVQGTKLRKTTVANLLYELRKQNVLRSDDSHPRV